MKKFIIIFRHSKAIRNCEKTIQATDIEGALNELIKNYKVIEFISIKKDNTLQGKLFSHTG